MAPDAPCPLQLRPILHWVRQWRRPSANRKIWLTEAIAQADIHWISEPALAPYTIFTNIGGSSHMNNLNRRKALGLLTASPAVALATPALAQSRIEWRMVTSLAEKFARSPV